MNEKLRVAENGTTGINIVSLHSKRIGYEKSLLLESSIIIRNVHPVDNVARRKLNSLLLEAQSQVLESMTGRIIRVIRECFLQRKNFRFH